MQLPAPPEFSREILSVGVTGTNGKTTTTTFLAHALATLGTPVVRVTTVGFFLTTLSSDGARDEPLDVPSTHGGFLEAMQRAHARGGRHAAIEYTSEALAYGFARAWPVRIGVFTNLTHDHLDAHGTPEHYLASKAQLFMALPSDGTAVLDGCDPASSLIAEVVTKGARIVRYGVKSRGEPEFPLDLRAEAITLGWDGTRIELASSEALGAVPKVLHVRAIGDVFAENALAALAAAICAGVDARAAANAIERATPPPGRFEVVAERPWVVVDYAHSPDALARTLSAARALCEGRLTVVFGAGGKRDRDKRAPMGAAAAAADRIVLTSDNPRDESPQDIADAIRAGIPGDRDVSVILDRAQAIARAITDAAPTDVVLIAGKGHETEQQIGATKRPFSDVEVARAAHAARR